jgi:hypothetical protein
MYAKLLRLICREQLLIVICKANFTKCNTVVDNLIT